MNTRYVVLDTRNKVVLTNPATAAETAKAAFVIDRVNKTLGTDRYQVVKH